MSNRQHAFDVEKYIVFLTKKTKHHEDKNLGFQETGTCYSCFKTQTEFTACQPIASSGLVWKETFSVTKPVH